MQAKAIVGETYKLGRSFVVRLPGQRDLIGALEQFCTEHGIQMAAFYVIGSVSSATVGVFDQQQKVYVTHRAQGNFEIVNCQGHISPHRGSVFVFAHITLADTAGRITGGRLFAETVIYAGEMVLQEYLGRPLERDYDRATGMLLWQDADRMPES